MKQYATIIGLSLDIIGFILVFFLGGFEVGRSALLLESDTTHKWKPLKWIGAVLVILGFAFQIWGAI